MYTNKYNKLIINNKMATKKNEKQFMHKILF